MTMGPAAHYSLEEIQWAIGKGAYAITLRAAADAASLDFDEEDVRDCILMLEPRHFYKSMRSKRRPGSRQDVYRCRHQGIAIYTKVQIGIGGRAVVISFKRDESA